MAVPLTLRVFKGDQEVTAKDYDRDIIKIGRLSSAHLCLEDEKVSRIHSVIEVGADGALSIIDMGSVEGTYVNGKRVNKGTLSFGDEIKVGATMIKVEQSATEALAENLAAAVAVSAPEGNTVVAKVDPAMFNDDEGEETLAAPPPAPVEAPVQAAAAPAPAPVVAAPAPVVAAPAPVAPV